MTILGDRIFGVELAKYLSRTTPTGGNMSEYDKLVKDREILTLDLIDRAKEIDALKAVLQPFAAIKADDGDTFDTWQDNVIIRCEITVGDLKKARSALEAKP